MTLLHGAELNIQPDGSLDWDDEFLAGFDILVASVHSHFNLPEVDMTRRIIRAMEHPLVNVIGHPTGRVLGRRPPIAFDRDEVFRAAARTGTALEINAFPDRLDLGADLIRQASDAGARFAISTDAHAVVHLDAMVYGVATAQRAWLSGDRVINTWPVDRLRSFLGAGSRLPPSRLRGR